MKDNFIYSVSDSSDVIYVGRTIDIDNRLLSHRRKFGNAISINVLEKCSGTDVGKREHYWIREMVKRGCILKNKVKTGKEYSQMPMIRVSNESHKWLSAEAKARGKGSPFNHTHSTVVSDCIDTQKQVMVVATARKMNVREFLSYIVEMIENAK